MFSLIVSQRKNAKWIGNYECWESRLIKRETRPPAVFSHVRAFVVFVIFSEIVHDKKKRRKWPIHKTNACSGIKQNSFIVIAGDTGLNPIKIWVKTETVDLLTSACVVLANCIHVHIVHGIWTSRILLKNCAITD